MESDWLYLKVKNVLDYLQEITGCYIKDFENKTEFSGTVRSYSNAQTLLKINNYIHNFNYEIAYQKEVDFLKNYIIDSRFSRELEELAIDCREFSEVLKKAGVIFEEYLKWFQEEQSRFRAYLFNNDFLKEEEKTDELLERFSYEWVAEAKESANNKSLQIYNFGDSSSDVVLEYGHTVPYIVSDALCISDDINLCISGINKKNMDSDKCYVNIALKIDSKEILFSYFIISVTYRGKTWVATDRHNFPNPYSKYKTRNPYRMRSDVFDNIQLPYGILDYIEDWRAENREVAKTDNTAELYIKSIKELFKPESKILLKLIIEEIVYNVIPKNQFNFKRIGLFTDTVKLLTSNNIENAEEVDDMFDGCFKEANNKRINDIIYPAETALIKLDASKSLERYVSSNDLCTYEELRKYSVWSQKEDSRKQKQKILDEAYTKEKMDSDEEELNKMILDNIERFYEILFSGAEVLVRIKGDANKRFASRDTDSDMILDLANSLELKYTWADLFLYNPETNSMKTFIEEQVCLCCGKSKAKAVNMRIYSYKMLSVILGIKREQLPYTFQNYTADAYIPYCGNSILDNINPEYSILDPRSKKSHNFFSIGVPLNKSCYNKLVKKYRKFEKSIVTIDYENGTLEIEEYKSK